MTEGGCAVAGSSAGVGGDSNSAAGGTPRVASSFVKFGDRTRFTVELRPGETTIVSWKKLMKDAAKAEGGGPSSASAVAAAAASTSAVASPEVPAAPTATATAAVPSLEARLAPGQPAANEDAPAPNRFSAVIEKIERLYMGNSSDEEDLDGIPADDQYDTEDSFIDDHELDEYFQVDKSKTKHDGYFVNRGTLEKVIEPPESVNPQPKKRKRKEMAKAAANNDDGQHPSKQIKAGRKGTGKAISAEKGVLPTSVGPSVNSFEEIKFKNHQKIPGDGNPLNDPSLRISHDDGSLTLAEFSNNQNSGVFPAKKPKKMREASNNGDRTESIRKSHSLKNNFEESDIVAHQNDKSGIRERIDLNLPDTKHLMQPVKNSGTHKKEGSSKSKANVLERAIRELEKMVAESRPPAPDAADGDFSSQSIKRRLPREIKQKLAKVARLSHASNGKVSKELLSRLMGILGHLIQVRTLKRHLKTMMTMSLSAKQEKDDKFQLTKKEVVEMVKVIFPSSLSKATEQQSGGSGDVQESSHSEKAAKGQLVMDVTLEDKICDLYDIFVDGLDEDAAPQVRKLYAELAELWPKGVMDNHGIKRAICRAKERRRAINEKNKEQEKMMRKVGLTNTEDGVHAESNSAAQSQYLDVRVSADPNLAVATQQNKVSSSTSYAAGNALIPMNNVAPAVTSSTSVPKIERPKIEKVKGTHSNSSLADTRMFDGIGMDVKKKVKKRAENLVGDAHIRTEKLPSHQGDDRQKQHKQSAASLQGAPHKSNYGDLQFEPLT